MLQWWFVHYYVYAVEDADTELLTMLVEALSAFVEHTELTRENHEYCCLLLADMGADLQTLADYENEVRAEIIAAMEGKG